MSIHQTVQADAASDALLAQIVGEFTDRLNRGERPTIEEYVEKYPEIAEQVRESLSALLLVRHSNMETNPAEDDFYLREQPLSDFHLVRKIGEGGMGIVYEAQQLSQGNRTVAVKILPHVAALDPRLLQRFMIEIRAASKLNHEHTVPVYCTGCEKNIHFYVMEFIDGLSLAHIIKKLRQHRGLNQTEQYSTVPYSVAAGVPPAAETLSAPAAAQTTEDAAARTDDTYSLRELITKDSILTLEFYKTVARFGLEAAKGLDRAHQEYIIHRDIKPANLLVDRLGNLKITDFGLAKMLQEINENMIPSLSPPGQLLGTPRYMSPEQNLGNHVPIDHRTDIYSLGATLYELLTLKPAFDGSRAELMRKIAFVDPHPPQKLNEKIPRDLETIVLRALAKAPDSRFATAKEMAEDLQRFLNDEKIKTQPENLLRWLWRKSRQRARGIGLGVAAGITSVILLLLLLQVSKPSQEEKKIKEQQEALKTLTIDRKANKKVTLIPEIGFPGYYEVKTDKKLSNIVEAPDGAFSVQGWESGLVELLPDPCQERYRFSAEVRHEKQITQASRVGIYFAHSMKSDGATVAHYHCDVTFNDLVDLDEADSKGKQKNNVVRLQIQRQAPAGMANEKKAQVQDAILAFPPAKPVGMLAEFRKIKVEVRRETVKVFWEGQCFATIPRAALLMNARHLIARPNQPLPDNAPEFLPRDGLGLYVSLGVASFKNVTVEPLDDE
jgi:serine/threonine protein kinase